MVCEELLTGIRSFSHVWITVRWWKGDGLSRGSHLNVEWVIIFTYFLILGVVNIFGIPKKIDPMKSYGTDAVKS